MLDKRITQRSRVLAMRSIKQQLSCLYREDLLAVQAALAAALLGAGKAPVDEQLTATGEWLEERRFLGKTGACHRYVYECWLDDTGHEHGHLLFAGTLAEYQASQVGKPVSLDAYPHQLPKRDKLQA